MIKISVLSSGKINKYEYLKGEEILRFNQKQVIEQAKFTLQNLLTKSTYSPFRKAFEKQTKTIEDQGREQVEGLKSLEYFDKQIPSKKDLISKERLNPEIIY